MFYNMISVYLFIMAVAVIYWAANIRTLNGAPYAYTAALLGFAICCYIIGYAMEINSSSVPQIMFWNRLEYLGIPFVSALWLTVALMYTGHFCRYRIPLLAGMYAIPVTSLFLRLTNGRHFLYFSKMTFVNQRGRLLFVKTHGPWMMVQTIHSLMMIFIALGLLIYDAAKNEEKQSGRLTLIILASVAAAAGLILSYIKPLGYAIDYMALCLPLSCLMVILAILRYDFLETKFLARSKAFDSGRNAVLLISPRNKIIDYNKNAKLLLSKLNINLTEGSLDVLLKNAPDVLASLKNSALFVFKLHIDSADRYYEISTKNIDDNKPSQGWIKTIRDVTEEYKLTKSLERQALMDDLSGLNNRRAFIRAGGKTVSESEKNGTTTHLLMLDLDLFKRVNDQYGHQMGDQVIRYMGNALKDIFTSDSFIARLGGEEFGILLSGFDDAGVQQKADAVLKRLETHEHHYKDQKFSVTASIGIAKKTRPEQTLGDLMHMADKALYRSKENGRNRSTTY